MLALEALRQDQKQAREMRLSLARKSFIGYCRLLYPNHYQKTRKYLTEICNKIQGFMNQNTKHFLVINLPPRHYKSFTATCLVEWLFGQNPEIAVMTGSYNEILSTSFARKVRDTISERKADATRVVYSDIFPKTQIKRGQASASLWALAGSSKNNYLATSPTGTATGFGANIVLIDDIIKNAEEAYNEMTLDKHWAWFTNTMIQRLEGNDWKVIVIMTRWALGDLAGRIVSAYGDDVETITMKAVQDNGEMLCDEILSRHDYEIKTREMNQDIVEANYNQQPIDVGGRLYGEFKEWEKLPPHSEVINFTDTADTGTDFLCSINGVVYQNEFYITDLVFTDEAMETTENQVADLLFSGETTTAQIESNNGGRGFARNVERILTEKYSSNRCDIRAVPQTHNKESRILASSAWVQNHIYMPLGWRQRFPEFYRQVMSYQKKGKNAHDDAVDVLASIYEYVSEPREVELLDKSMLSSPRARHRNYYWKG